MNGITIRDARIDDYADIKYLMELIFALNVKENNYIDYIREPSNLILVATTDAGKVVGVACAERQWQAFSDYHNYYLRNCGVLPEYRRRGIYSALIGLIKERANEEGIHHIELTAGIHRSATHRFYLNHDFTIKKTLVFICELAEGNKWQ